MLCCPSFVFPSQVMSVSTLDITPSPGDRPGAPQDETPGASLPQALPARPGILVVDDDPHVLGLLRVALPESGFRVWTAQDGLTAVGLFGQHRAEIHLVLLDVRMPHLDGPQTLRLLKATDPGVVSCFMTGHPGDYSGADLESLGSRHCFFKPFHLPEVLQTLRELLA
jgi:DNA-binding response OmpR family regulator